MRVPIVPAAMAAGLISDWGTYATCSFELASALHQKRSMWTMFAAVAFSFVSTQVPLGIAEGVITAGAYRFVLSRRPELLHPRPLGPIRRGRDVMTKRLAMLAVAILAAVVVGCWGWGKVTGEEWKGVDDTVIEKVAKEAGRTPGKPLINTDQGDILLCMFLLAGAVGGFVVGYNFRNLFAPGAGSRRRKARIYPSFANYTGDPPSVPLSLRERVREPGKSRNLPQAAVLAGRGLAVPNQPCTESSNSLSIDNDPCAGRWRGWTPASN